MTPPASPAQLSASARPGAVELRWVASRDDVGVAGYEVLREGRVVATVAGPAAEESGLPPARERCYTVRALDAAANRSEPSTPACATPPDVTPPSPPRNAEAVAGGEDRITVRWGAAADDVGVARYEVARGEIQVASVAGLEALETGLGAWTEHCYVVHAVDAAGNRSAPAGPVCQRTLDVTAPTPPAGLEVRATSEERVELSWEPSTDNTRAGVAAYEVWREERTVARVEGTRAEESGIRPWLKVCYTVVAVDAAKNRSSPTAPACTRTLDVTAPTAPADLAVRPASESQVEARWSPSIDNHRIAGYELLRAGQVVAWAPGPAAVDSKLAPSTEHCYAVRAYDAAGNRSGATGPVCTTTLRQGQPPPPRGVAVQQTPSAVDLRWEAPPRANLVYRVFEDGRLVGATRFFSYTVSRRIDGKRRCYEVGAVDDAGHESPRSEEVCLSFLPEGVAGR